MQMVMGGLEAADGCLWVAPICSLREQVFPLSPASKSCSTYSCVESIDAYITSGDYQNKGHGITGYHSAADPLHLDKRSRQLSVNGIEWIYLSVDLMARFTHLGGSKAMAGPDFKVGNHLAVRFRLAQKWQRFPVMKTILTYLYARKTNGYTRLGGQMECGEQSGKRSAGYFRQVQESQRLPVVPIRLLYLFAASTAMFTLLGGVTRSGQELISIGFRLVALSRRVVK